MDTIVSIIFYALIALFLFGLYKLARLIIEKYYESRIARSRSTTYPFILGMTFLFLGFSNISNWNWFVEFLINLINKKTSLDIVEIPYDDIYALVVYLLFCCSICITLYFFRSKLKRLTQLQPPPRCKYFSKQPLFSINTTTCCSAR